MLKMEDLSVSYGDLEVLHNVSLEVGSGETVAVVGSNGAGKTTLINTISGVVTGRGRIVFLEQDIGGLPPHRRVELGLVQVPEGRRLFPFMSVTENLELGSYPNRCRRLRSESMKAVFDIFPVLFDRRNQLAGSLSGGEQQMLAIGRALMSRPKLLMLDELSLGLAPKIVKQMFDVVRQIRTEGIAVLLVEQNVQHALRLADRAYVLEAGKIVLSGRAADLLNDEGLRRAYLGIS